MISWGLLIIFIFVSISYSYWFLIAATILVLWRISQFWFCKSRPWRRIHYPAMRLYSRSAGYGFGQSIGENREFDFKNALINFLSSVKPEWSSDMIESFINREIERSQNYEDWKLIKTHVLSKKKKTSEQQIDKALDEFKSKIDPLDRAWLVRMIIAGIIEHQYSQKDRGEYLYEVMVGNAK